LRKEGWWTIPAAHPERPSSDIGYLGAGAIPLAAKPRARAAPKRRMPWRGSLDCSGGPVRVRRHRLDWSVHRARSPSVWENFQVAPQASKRSRAWPRLIARLQLSRITS